ncbi:MAG: phosphatidylglycerophosphatase A [Gammaproteobacteria bacterium]|nr:phosphatidylglycerophosphatase A [Gammaproteobacteria bacterium]
MPERISPTLRHLLDPGHCLAFGFGAGLAPKATGTVGTLLAIPLYLLMVTAFSSPLVYGLLVAVIIIVAIPLSARAATALGVDDHPAIVLDEIAGFLVTMFALVPSWQAVAAGFVLFRLFDIIKPGPIGLADRRIHGGIGIVLDDLLAGAAACSLLHLAEYMSLI